MESGISHGVLDREGFCECLFSDFISYENAAHGQKFTFNGLVNFGWERRGSRGGHYAERLGHIVSFLFHSGSVGGLFSFHFKEEET